MSTRLEFLEGNPRPVSFTSIALREQGGTELEGDEKLKEPEQVPTKLSKNGFTYTTTQHEEQELEGVINSADYWQHIADSYGTVQKDSKDAEDGGYLFGKKFSEGLNLQREVAKLEPEQQPRFIKRVGYERLVRRARLLMEIINRRDKAYIPASNGFREDIYYLETYPLKRLLIRQVEHMFFNVGYNGGGNSSTNGYTDTSGVESGTAERVPV